MAAKKKEKVTEPEMEQQEPLTPDRVLEGSIGKGYSNVIVIGIHSNGVLDLNTNTPHWAFINHLIDRAQHKILSIEDAQVMERVQAKETAEL